MQCERNAQAMTVESVCVRFRNEWVLSYDSKRGIELDALDQDWPTLG